MKIMGENLRIGDVLRVAWAGKSVAIVAFEAYTGPLDWIGKVAVLADGSRMSISYGRYYECVRRA